jgi:hypothetical protein
MAHDADSERVITDHGFRWLGQSWQSCDQCGKPWDQHKGLDEPCRKHLFCGCKSTIRRWKKAYPTAPSSPDAQEAP